MNERERSIRTLYVALTGGAVLWIGTIAATGQREAWDSLHYWTISYPIGLAFAAVLGFLVPIRAWRWGLAVVMVQPLLMLLTSGSSLALLPMGATVFLVMSIPAVLAAMLAARLRLWRDA